MLIVAHIPSTRTQCNFEELNKMIIELMLDFHAWSTSRPTQENDTTADTLEREINSIMETEKEQGRFLSSSPSCSCFIGRPMFCILVPIVCPLAGYAYILLYTELTLLSLKRGPVNGSTTLSIASRWLWLHSPDSDRI
jgi:hypothetical protein